MTTRFSYRHLHYFWVVAKEGGFTPAAERLGVAVQTISAQVRELERDLGHELLKLAGRRVVLTDAGAAVLSQADLIFALGAKLPDIAREAASPHRLRFAVGISDGVPKLVVSQLLLPVTGMANLHLSCHEDEFADLLGDLALHRFDAVLADQPAPANPNLKVFTHPLAKSPLAWYAPAPLAASAQRDFPQSMGRVPVLLPTSHSAVRERLNRWFEREGITPDLAGEFEDSALLATFAATGMGVFPAPSISDTELVRQGFERIGYCSGVEEEFFLICAHRKSAHPLVRRVLDARA